MYINILLRRNVYIFFHLYLGLAQLRHMSPDHYCCPEGGFSSPSTAYSISFYVFGQFSFHTCHAKLQMGSGRLDRSCNNNAYWVCKWFQNNFVEQRQHVSALHSSIWLANPSLHPATPKALWGLSHPIEELLSQLGFFLDLQGKVVAKLNRSSISRKLPAFDHTSRNPIRQLLVGKDPKQNHPSRLVWSQLCKFMSV